MQRLRRLIAWGFYVGFLAAVGIVTFLYVRHSPRSTITGQIEPLHLWPDGSRLATIRVRFGHGIGGAKGGRGPLQVWDAGTGKMIRQHLDDRELWDEMSPDGRRIALIDDKGALCIVNWQTGEEWRCADPPASRFGKFSAKGRWFYSVAKDEDETVVLDVSTREVRLRIKEAAIHFSPDERWLFARKELAIDFNPDDRWLFACGQLDDDNPPVSVWDVAAARKVATIPSDAVRTFFGEVRVDVSRDGKAVGVCVPAESGPDDGIVRHQAFEIWSLPEGKKRFRYDLPVIGAHDFIFAPDSRTVAGWLSYDDDRPSQLTMFDVTDGRRLWQAPVLRASRGRFSQDGSLFLLCQGKGPNYTVRVFDAASGQMRWQQPGWGWDTFAGNTVVLNRAADELPLHILDAHTGAAKQTLSADFRMNNSFPILTPGGSHFVIDGFRSRGRKANFFEIWLDERWPELLGEGMPSAVVVESATGRVMFSVVNRGAANGIAQTVLSDDGSTVVTSALADAGATTTILRIWDIHPRRAYTWSLAAVAATMLALFALSRLLRAWRKRAKAAAPTPNVS